MPRKKKAVEPVTPPTDDIGLGAWCEAMGLRADGGPLPREEAAKRALEQQLEAERLANERATKNPTPFWRLPTARDL
jgi:hypothetical protein